MRNQFEPFYEQELFHIRQLAAEFARDRPKIAGRLDLESGISVDPHVERLIESFAFLTARVRLKLEDEFPELTDALLGVLYPHYLAPVPSMAIVQFHLDSEQGQLSGGYTIPRHSQLYSREIGGVPCRFRTAYPVTLWPIEVAAAECQLAPFGAGIKLPAGTQDTEALLRLELRTIGDITFSDLELDRLRFFIAGDDRTVHQLYELLLTGVTQVMVRPVDASSKLQPTILPDGCLQPVGFGRDEGLLPYGNQSFMGYRLLTEYFTFPSKFLFVDMVGLSAARSAAMGDGLELFLLLKQADRSLESRVGAKSFRLGCCPIVNLFKQLADPIQLTHTKSEYRVFPDVRHAGAMEVYSIDSVQSTDSNTGESVEYEPFFAARHGAKQPDDISYWYARRTASVRTNDPGTEMLLSLVDLSFNPKLPPTEVLSVSTTCTNRDLPGSLRVTGGESWGFHLEGQAPVRGIEPVVMPTASARLPLREGRWRLISHLSLNHLSITEGESGADALREILKLYDFANTRVTVQQISGIVSVSSRRKTARLADGSASGFCRGVEITVEFDPEMYAGSGIYLFASVLDRFFGLYASINSFTCLITKLKGVAEPWKRWPNRAGEQTLI